MFVKHTSNHSLNSFQVRLQDQPASKSSCEVGRVWVSSCTKGRRAIIWSVIALHLPNWGRRSMCMQHVFTLICCIVSGMVLQEQHTLLYLLSQAYLVFVLLLKQCGALCYIRFYVFFSPPLFAGPFAERDGAILITPKASIWEHDGSIITIP